MPKARMDTELLRSVSASSIVGMMWVTSVEVGSPSVRNKITFSKKKTLREKRYNNNAINSLHHILHEYL